MATYFVASGGSNTSPYDTWAKAATSIATALAAATADGDVIVVQYNAVPSADAEAAADTTYTFAGNCTVVAASNDGGSAYTATAMGAANWIGNSTANCSITFAGLFKVRVSGLTLRTAGTLTDSFNLGGGSGSQYTYENCYFWLDNALASAAINMGAAARAHLRFVNCTYRFGHVGQGIKVGASFIEIIGGGISSAGSAPSPLFEPNGMTGACVLKGHGFDVSHVGSGSLIANFTTTASLEATFERCKLGVGMTVLDTQTVTNRSSAQVSVLDCASGDTHGFFGYYDAFGSLTSDTGLYLTAGAAVQSWKVVTTAHCSFATPFITPWVPFYNTATSALTPYFEILRDGSATAYNNDEVWAEFLAKVTAGSTLASHATGRKVTGATAAALASGAGLASWTGESGTAWSGKCDSGSSVTPAESGVLSGRVSVGAASSTVYIDPQVRT